MRAAWLLGAACGLAGVSAVEARPGLQANAATPTQVPVIADGAAAFKVRGCAQCHAIEGVGGHKGPDLSGIGRRSRKDAIELQIVKGGDAMPEFGDVLQAAEIKGLVDYLHKQRAKTPAWPVQQPTPTPPKPDETGDPG